MTDVGGDRHGPVIYWVDMNGLRAFSTTPRECERVLATYVKVPSASYVSDLERENAEMDALLSEGGTWESQISDLQSRLEKAEGALFEVANYLDCECDSDSILHEIMEAQADRYSFKERLENAEAERDQLVEQQIAAVDDLQTARNDALEEAACDVDCECPGRSIVISPDVKSNSMARWQACSEANCSALLALDIRALKSSPPTPAERDGWQPIETAPRDGTPVDLWMIDEDGRTWREPDAYWVSARSDERVEFFEDGSHKRTYITRDGWFAPNHTYDGQDGWCDCPRHFNAYRNRWFFTEATHWRPLPSPPTPDQG